MRILCFLIIFFIIVNATDIKYIISFGKDSNTKIEKELENL